MNVKKILLIFLVSTLVSSCKPKKHMPTQAAISVPQRYWQNARTIQIPGPAAAINIRNKRIVNNAVAGTFPDLPGE